jgi:multiple sugar transport system permease protein
MKNARLRKAGGNVFYVFVVIFFLLFTIGPIAWSFIMSITPTSELSASDTILPQHPTMKNYEELLSPDDQQGTIFMKGLMNSLVAAALSILLGIPLSILSAYPLARMRFKGRQIVKYGLLVTMVIPALATVIPIFRIFSIFKLIDNFFALAVVYVSSFLPLSVWLLTSFFETIPKEIEEAAEIDGCGKFAVLVRIVVRISYPAIFAATLIVFLTTWNQFLIPLILSPTYATKPIAIVISEFVTKASVNYGLMNAGGIIAIIPPALIAVVFRRFLVKGITAGATKG